jgi:hypothetical protein
MAIVTATPSPGNVFFTAGGDDVAIDSQEVSGIGHNSSTSPLTWTFTNIGGNLLIVAIDVNSTAATPPAIGAVSYGGQAMAIVPNSLNEVVAAANSAGIAFYYLFNPPKGANTVSVAFSGGTTPDVIAGAISFQGAAAIGLVNTASGVYPSTVATLTLPATKNLSMVVSALSTGTGVISATAPTTISWQRNVSGTNKGDNAALGVQGPVAGGSITVGYAVGADYWNLDALEIFPAVVADVIRAGAGSGSVAFAAQAVAEVLVAGVASGAVAFTGAISSTRVLVAAAIAAIVNFSGNATATGGKGIGSGTGVGSVVFTGNCSATVISRQGIAFGNVAFIGAAAAAQLMATSAQGAVGFVGTANAIRVSNTHPAGTGAGQVTFSGVCNATVGTVPRSVVTTYVTKYGETLPSLESSILVATGGRITVQDPSMGSPPADAIGWNVYISASPGAEVLQNISGPIAFGSNWTESLLGLVTGTASPPTVNSTGWDVFNAFVPDVVPSATYQTQTIDTGYNSNMRVFFNDNSGLGFGQTGVPNVGFLIDDWLSGGFDPGTYQPWVIGTATFRYLKGELDYAPIVGGDISYFTDFVPTVDTTPVTEQSGQSITIAAGGTVVIFPAPFHNPPLIGVTPTSAGATSASVTNVTNTQFTYHIWTGAVDSGGTGSWSATGE